MVFSLDLVDKSRLNWSFLISLYGKKLSLKQFMHVFFKAYTLHKKKKS